MSYPGDPLATSLPGYPQGTHTYASTYLPSPQLGQENLAESSSRTNIRASPQPMYQNERTPGDEEHPTKKQKRMSLPSPAEEDDHAGREGSKNRSSSSGGIPTLTSK